MKYYFQLKDNTNDWDSIKPIVLEFDKKSEAISLARNLWANNGQREVRLTDNENLLNGTYIRN